MKITLEEAAKKLLEAHRVAISAHVNPDGDAVGSCLGLAGILRARGIQAEVLLDDAPPGNLKFLPGIDGIRHPDGKALEVDLRVVLDADLDRINNAFQDVSPAPTLNIDHHITNRQAADFFCVENRAATAEMITELAVLMEVEPTPEIALCLYTGLATDTGFFRFPNTRPETMRMAARLMEAGAKPNVVSEHIEEKPLSVFLGQAAALQMLEMSSGGRVAGVYLDQELTKKLEASEGFIDMIRVIEGAEAAVLVRCLEPSKCRVSIRSKGLDVTKVVMPYGGGGHVRAAGCTLNMPLDEAKKTIQKALDDLLPPL